MAREVITNTAGISKVDNVMFVNRIREMVSFELDKEIEKDIFRPVSSPESEGLRISSLSHARDRTKAIFLYFFTELKTCHLS